MTKPSNISAIEKATKMLWAEWVTYLDASGGKNLQHRAIADKAYEKLKDGWWSQAVAVAYEQHIGRRAPGQRSDGSYEVSVTKTMSDSMDHAMKTWLQLAKGRNEFAGSAVAKEPTATKSDKRRHWACNLADGTRVNADVYPKSADKVLFSVTHTKLASAKAAETLRTYWKEFIESL